MKYQILFSCEHASKAVPIKYGVLFRGKASVLASHRGWDEGALTLANYLARALQAPLIAGKHTRLLADLNRTEDHHSVFSEFTRALPAKDKKFILDRFHRPHWRLVRKRVEKMIKKGSTLHVGVHTFTPVFHGHRRATGIGLLCDPSRSQEYELCKRLQKELRRLQPFPVHLNLPYRGTGNGLTTGLRRELSQRRYLGIELEVNQACLTSRRDAQMVALALAKALRRQK